MKIKIKGFTLIEMLVTLALGGILASIAIPTYRDSIVKSKRAEAQAALMSLSNAMESYRIQNSNSYLGATLGTGGIFTNQTPVGGGKKTYTLSIPTLTASTYVLQATAVEDDSSCGNTLTLSNTGSKTPSTAGCW